MRISQWISIAERSFEMGLAPSGVKALEGLKTLLDLGIEGLSVIPTSQGFVLDVEKSTRRWIIKIDNANKRLVLSRPNPLADPITVAAIKALAGNKLINNWPLVGLQGRKIKGNLRLWAKRIKKVQTHSPDLGKTEKTFEDYSYEVARGLGSMWFYHATRVSNWASIKKNGLLPSGTSSTEGWSVLNLEMQNAVYLTTSLEYAIKIGWTLADRFEEDAVILRVPGSFLEPNKLVIDEDILRSNYDQMLDWSKFDERFPQHISSLVSKLESLGYSGTIPPSKVKLHQTLEWEDEVNAAAGAGDPDLAYLLLPPGKTKQIGAERGKVPTKDGLARYSNPPFFNSYRYVWYIDGQAVSAIQVMRRKHPTKWIGHVANVFTHPDWRRKGLATKLFRQAEKDFDVLKHSKDLSTSGSSWKSSLG
jgi:hypothetical protein